ncbi:RecQ family ATP-dependent DNA helicase [Bergeyella zoohelcum]|uniref:RecQ family ATP-dependent DNA helicase n=1 Tax=Bergeyella zoohelcum TaxID=1015 RepID=UPI002A919BCA|nr:RecQ family ATP-dependent DNA helicase [Bergeyella zoohelcum]MDY6025225.1 RecQ family ATP-dependent DNA helicase [Bergeyella zoohelcum]
MQRDSELKNLLLQTLHYYWKHQAFRALQEETIRSLLQGKDTLTLLPTGGGKSLCYQLPAVLSEGVCIVISPLLALMKDQVQSLQRKNIPSAYLSSEMEDYQMDEIYQKCKEGLIKILFISPERLSHPSFIYNFQEIKVSFIAVDEAHCISEWGQDFRPSYQNIKKFRAQFPHLPCLALTATATPKVIEEISKKLELQAPNIFRKSYRRENLSLHVLDIVDKYEFIYQFLAQNKTSGLIYTRTRKEAEDLFHFLSKRNIDNIDFFHAGLPTAEKNKKQRKWQYSNVDTLICTNAFGMGIDKENVQFVIHLSPSQSIENYYQEIGRAGRNGAEAHTFLLWNTAELKSIDGIIHAQTPSKQEFSTIVRAVYSLCQVADHEHTSVTFQLPIERIEKVTKIHRKKIISVLNFLHNQEIIYHNTRKRPSSIELKISTEQIGLMGANTEYFLELLLRNIPGIAQYKAYFNEEKLLEKLQINTINFQEKIRELSRLEILEYMDGQKSSIQFLTPRQDYKVEKEYWKLFYQIQKNNIQKWEEMKFFIQNQSHCKMKLILSYFGEKSNFEKCNQCSVCYQYPWNNAQPLSTKIIELLALHPMGIDELAIRLIHFDKETILETVIELREAGIITMHNFRTYRLT